MDRKAVSGIMLALLLTSTLTLALSIELVSAIIPPEPEYPAIYVDPPIVENIMPPNNFTVAIKTNYNGTDITSWQFTLSYNPRVLNGGIRDTDTWTGDGVTKTFNTTKTPLVPDSEMIYVNDTLMTIKTQGNDTWTGDGLTKTFNTTVKPIVLGSEVVYMNEGLMTRRTVGNDTWTGDGLTKTFPTTKKPLVSEEDVRVFINYIAVPHMNYTVDCSEGIIEFKEHVPAPADGAEVMARYKYGHYTVGYSEGKITFLNFTIPANGTKVGATYTYDQYSVDHAEGKITFMTAPSEGTRVEVAYLYGGVTNGDLITLDMPRAAFTEGTFNNTLGRLSVTNAYFFPLPPPIPMTSGPGTLATIAFTVVGEGTSDITFEKPALVGVHDGDTYCIVDDTMPEHIGHGYFDNTAPPPATIATIAIHPHTLILRSKGRWITAYIELLEDHDVGDLDVSTILLNDTIPAELHPTAVGDEDSDGIPDLMVKFDKAEVMALLSVGEATLTITGEVDGTKFEGSDSIRVILPSSGSGGCKGFKK